jgi:hypothetical protein|tara:strand:+ start:178 stop:513 length:336 start_codon:yes stop_codon:yes gene_type:complete
MWEEVLKAAKRLNYNFLKEIVLAKGKEMKGEVLSADEYLQLLEEINQSYAKKHTSHANQGGGKVDLNRIKNVTTKILRENNLLEVKRKNKIIFDNKGNRLGTKGVNEYHFI